jgi:hypothetical protein
MKQFMDGIIQDHQESRVSGGDDREAEDLLDVLLRLQKEAIHSPRRTSRPSCAKSHLCF